MQQVTTFLMFEGNAEEAMTLYTSIFENSKILQIDRYGAAGPGPEGTVMKARFTINGQEFMAIDSPSKHAFGFTPAISLFIRCDSTDDIERLFEKLADGGQVMMPLGEYPFSDKFGWVSDKFGVSWQLSKV